MIKPEKTIMELEQILVKFNARGILKEYSGGVVDSVAFYIEKNGRNIPFKMPMKLECARRVVVKAVDEGKLPSKFRDEPHHTEKARIVGWRIIKDWVHSQLSMLEVEFADPVELLLPFVYDDVEKRTLYDKIVDDGKLLPYLDKEGDD